MSVQKSATETTQTALCGNCHTFYGTQNTDWLCSSCYKQAKSAKTQQKKQTKLVVEPETPKVKEITPVFKEEEAPKVQETTEQIQKDRKRCFACQKKIGLLGIECKCKFVFCNSHRMPQDHECQFNFKEKGMKELQKTVVKVEHSKVTQI